MSEAEYPEDLVLSHPTYEMSGQRTLPTSAAEVLKYIDQRRMWGEQTPKGSIMFIDLSKPSPVILVDKDLKKVGEFDPSSKLVDMTIPNADGSDQEKPEFSKDIKALLETVTQVKKEISASVIKTDPLTPAWSEEIKALLKILAKKANIQRGQKDKDIKEEHGITTIDIPSQAGVVFIYEVRGADTDEAWRKQLMVDAGLHRVNVNAGRVNHPILWEAGRKRKSIPQEKDISKTKAAKRVRHATQANIYSFSQQGSEVNHKKLIEDQQRSRMIPGTIERSEDFQSVTIQDRTTGDIVTRDSRGNVFKSDVASLDDREQQKRIVEDELERLKKTQKKSRMGSLADPLFRVSALNPGRNINTEHKCFNCRNEGRESNLSYLQYTDTDKQANFIALMCAAHGRRYSYPAPSPSQVRSFEYRNKR